MRPWQMNLQANRSCDLFIDYHYHRQTSNNPSHRQKKHCRICRICQDLYTCISMSAAMNVNITWCPSLACCCTAPTHCCPPNCTRCSTPPTPWRLGTPPRTRPPRCPCSWWAQLCQEATGYLPTRTRTRTHRFTFLFLQHFS